MTKKDKPSLFNQKYQSQWSETHKYKHIHTGEYCTFEAYVAEYIVLRRAEKLNLGKPSYKFWTKGDPNHWLWKKQLGAARQLKKKYSEEAILRAIKSKEFDKLLVLGVQDGRGYKINPLAERVIAMYESRVREEADKQKALEAPITTEPPQQLELRKTQTSTKNKTMLNKLRDL
jgi:hypothetical protein